MDVDDAKLRPLNTLCFGGKGELEAVTEAAQRFHGDSLHALMAGGGPELIAAIMYYTAINVEAIRQAFAGSSGNHMVLVVGDDALLRAIRTLLTGDKRYVQAMPSGTEVVQLNMDASWVHSVCPLP